jgi:hypothetical protein
MLLVLRHAPEDLQKTILTALCLATVQSSIHDTRLLLAIFRVAVQAVASQMRIWERVRNAKDACRKPLLP